MIFWHYQMVVQSRMWGLAGGSWSPWLHPRKIQCLWPVLGLSSSLLLSCYAVSSGVLACLPITMPCPSQTPEQGRQSAAPRMGCQQFGEHPPQPGMREPEELDGPRVSKSMLKHQQSWMSDLGSWGPVPLSCLEIFPQALY